jgi:hypothetical protein
MDWAEFLPGSIAQHPFIFFRYRAQTPHNDKDFVVILVVFSIRRPPFFSGIAAKFQILYQAQNQHYV